MLRINGITEVSRPKIYFRDSVWFQDGCNRLQIVNFRLSDGIQIDQITPQIPRISEGDIGIQHLSATAFSSLQFGQFGFSQHLEAQMVFNISNIHFPCYFNIFQCRSGGSSSPCWGHPCLGLTSHKEGHLFRAFFFCSQNRRFQLPNVATGKQNGRFWQAKWKVRWNVLQIACEKEVPTITCCK